MSRSPARKLVVKVTCGTDDPERANQAFTVAAAACASGVAVSLWLTGEAVFLGVPGAPSLGLEHATPVADLLAVVLAAEAGEVTACSQCVVRRGLGQADLLPGVRVAGAAVFAEEILMPDVQAIVY
ncbi:DsrE family protein [Nocardioides psychrotolerans]|uniref:Predicted peroxiredoxin n=1 Tax=Nocardioides psychrotolerans TaxID=1005945 RepID=A0A1I3N9C0_9ACTN|nr:DsrE family protein [Nocardioides psychrotolerans]SFJ05809.1 Predicted peroxiredoxin [Nocardioides psychrotolerans]